jgi:hypothetical protein
MPILAAALRCAEPVKVFERQQYPELFIPPSRTQGLKAAILKLVSQGELRSGVH